MIYLSIFSILCEGEFQTLVSASVISTCVFEGYWILALICCACSLVRGRHHNLPAASMRCHQLGNFPTQVGFFHQKRESRIQLHRVETDYKVSRHNSVQSSHWRPPKTETFVDQDRNTVWNASFHVKTTENTHDVVQRGVKHALRQLCSQKETVANFLDPCL